MQLCIVKIVASEVDFRVLQTNDWTNRAMQLKSITGVPTRAIFSENFSSIRLVLSSPLDDNKKNNNNNNKKKN